MSDDWSGLASWGLRILINTRDCFTADDLIHMVGYPDENHEPNGRNNAIGKLFAEAHKQGLIEMVGTMKSKRPTRKKGAIRIWTGA